MTFRSITAISILLPLLLTGCSTSFLSGDFPMTGGATIEARKAPEVISADREAIVNIPKVEVSTIPAPVVTPKPEPQPESKPESKTAASVSTPVVKPNAKSATTPNPPAPPAASAPVRVPEASQADRGHEWINATMAKYGVYPEPGTKFVIGPMPAGCEGADGCTEWLRNTKTGVYHSYTITLRPGQLTEYLLIHEIAHARGVRDECAADNFARSILGPISGHYC